MGSRGKEGTCLKTIVLGSYNREADKIETDVITVAQADKGGSKVKDSAINVSFFKAQNPTV